MFHSKASVPKQGIGWSTYSSSVQVLVEGENLARFQMEKLTHEVRNHLVQKPREANYGLSLDTIRHYSDKDLF